MTKPWVRKYRSKSAPSSQELTNALSFMTDCRLQNQRAALSKLQVVEQEHMNGLAQPNLATYSARLYNKHSPWRSLQFAASACAKQRQVYVPQQLRMHEHISCKTFRGSATSAPGSIGRAVSHQWMPHVSVHERSIRLYQGNSACSPVSE